MAKKGSVEQTIAKDYGDSLLVSGRDLLEKKIVTIPVSPKIDLILGGGIQEGSRVILTGQPKYGKFHHVDSTIFTPSGPRRFGDLKIGDQVCTPFHEASKVVGVFPQGQQDVYKVIFRKGDTYECGLDHLWEVRHRSLQHRVLTLQQILDRGLFIREGKKQRPKWSVITPVCNFDYNDIYIDPYILGLLLGDGSITSDRLKFTSRDQELLDHMNQTSKKCR